jgi:hypothetical protein
MQDVKLRSGFFRDMLMQSTFSTSLENPIALNEYSYDIKTLLIVICGDPCQASKRCMSWRTAKQLYALMQKYQLDRLQSWFSANAGRFAGNAPFEALLLAIDNPCFDEYLIRCAIYNGIELKTAEKLFDKEYFLSDKASVPIENRKACLLAPGNLKVDFMIALGVKGMTGYCRAFSDLKGPPKQRILWRNVAELFINGVRQFERAKGSSVSR